MLKKAAIIAGLILFYNLGIFLIIWVVNSFVVDLSPIVGSIVSLLTILLAIPLFLFVVRRSYVYLNTKPGASPSLLFGTGAIALAILFGLNHLIYGESTLDIAIHDTYFVLAYSTTFVFLLLLFFFFSLFYSVYSKITKRQLSDRLSYIHFLSTLTMSSILLLWRDSSVPTITTIPTIPRRYLDYNPSLHNTIDQFLIYVVLSLFLFQLPFFINIIYSLFKGNKS